MRARRHLVGPLAAILLVAFGSGAGCNDIDLIDQRDDAVDPEDTASDPNTPVGDDTIWPPQEGEACNGLDDDGDGEIDEGFPDIDEDGIADCVDRDCDVERGRPGEIGIQASCSPSAVGSDGEAWEIDIEWRWDGTVAVQDGDDDIDEDGDGRVDQRNVLMAPVVGNLTDDNGDGVIDADDVPDIVFVGFDDVRDTEGTLVVLDGETGMVLANRRGYLPFGGLVLGDSDGDGVNDIIAFQGGDPEAGGANDPDMNKPVRIVLEERPGFLFELVEVATATARSASTYPHAALADLDGDGQPEILADDLVLDGTTMEVRHRARIPAEIVGRMPAVGDIDLDGQQEYVLGQQVFGPFGELEWVTPVRGTYGHWSAILDADGDAYGEVAFVGDGRLVIHEHDGRIRVDVPAGTDQPGPPCVADFDGDGVSEIAWGSSDTFNVYELDGTVVWTFRMSDQSGLAACSGYDFDADGAYEILFADERAVHVFDGRTGRILYMHDGHASGTVFEYPIVADVDRDGSAEFVLASSNYRHEGEWSGVAVFGQRRDRWARSGPTWHVHDFAVTNIDEDGHVPAQPDKAWQRYNVYRARPPSDALYTDLRVAFTDVCYTGCAGPAMARVAVQVFNTGSSTSFSQVPVALYAVDGEAREIIQVKRQPGRVPAGRSARGIVFEVPIAAVGPDGLLVRVNDDGSGGPPEQEECDLSNNEDAWFDPPCEP